MVHGRESYRRNSFLVLYMFYKNALYVSTQYWFGYMSGYSGQTLYDPVIYQLFNITMTSLPIGWFALFDYQYSKDDDELDHIPLPDTYERDVIKQRQVTEDKLRNPDVNSLMQNPNHYSIGIEEDCYSISIFIKTFLRGAVLDAFLVLNFVYYCTVNTVQQDGKEYGMWSGGMAVYVTTCIVANLYCLVRFHQHDFGSTILFSMMFIAPWLIYWILSLIKVTKSIDKIYMDFGIQGSGLIWMGYFLSIAYILNTEHFSDWFFKKEVKTTKIKFE